MRKIAGTLVLFILSVVSLSAKTFKIPCEKGFLEYKILSDTEVELKNGKGITNVIVPETVTWHRISYTVVGIGESAFYKDKSLESIHLPKSIRWIEDSAFNFCKKLREFEWPAQISRIPYACFGGCINLERIKIPEGVREIRGNAFHGCDNLKEISLPSSIKVIGAASFCGSGISKINLPAGLEIIKEGTFLGCQNLTEITLPSSIKKIEKNAFGFSGLREINFPVGLESIEEKAFFFCIINFQIPLPRTALSIHPSAFWGISSKWKGIDRSFDYTSLPDYVTLENCELYGVEKGDFQRYLARKNGVILPQNNMYAGGQAQPSNYVMPSSPLPAVPMSDVDKDIFKTSRKSADTYAVVIANEQYSQCVDVEFAGNDGEIMCQYLENTLGIPKKQISYYKNASYATMESALSRLEKLSAVLDGDMNVVFYYAGHGIPDEKSHEAYLVPCDVDGKDTRFCMHTGQMYKRLAALNTRQVVVLMDACFSGSTRGDQMINPVRGVAIAPKESAISGKMVVLTAASADESALPSSENGHGMFTYHLLKKLQQSHGEATLGEIADYVIKNVRRESLLDKNKLQSPTIKTSLPQEEWRTWTL